jgi:two-component sensor histidine kinase/HAMP domain-containing protein
MKLQYKAAEFMIFIAVIIVICITVVYSNHNRQIVLQKELQNIKNIAEEIALHMDSHLEANITITTTISSAPVIRDALLKSNAEYTTLSVSERKNRIDMLNHQWMEAKDVSDSFIQKYLTNPVAEFLKLQQINMPELFGEIFLTNHYGAMIASTGKLTTLAHAHKYWWEAGYHEGKGRVFLDDRGFDTSVEGYVLGIVVPIKSGNEIIGILKCNVNLMGPLTNIIQDFEFRNPGRIQIVRTKGLIVAEGGEIPLSNRLSEALVQHIKTGNMSAVLSEDNNKKTLVASFLIPLTRGSEKFGFGGSYESIDHIKGNQGEAWHIVITLDRDIALKEADKTNQLLIIVGIIFIVMASIIALLLGKWFATPLAELSGTAQKIVEGQLDTRISITRKDEIGTLAQSVKNIADNLASTLTSRDNLAREVEFHRKTEKQIKSHLKEKETLLKEIHHRVKNNLAVVSSLLELQSSSINDERLKAALTDSQNRVQSISAIHETLYQSENLSSIDLNTYLPKLARSVAQNHIIDSKVNLKIEAEDIVIGVKQASILGLIVNELITNSYKYAFPDRQEGEIKIRLQKIEDQIELEYADNGIGVPKDFDWENIKSMGLSLVKLLGEDQLGGSIRLNRDKGTCFIIKFKHSLY